MTDADGAPGAASPEGLLRNIESGNGRFRVLGDSTRVDPWVAAARQARRRDLVPRGYRLETKRSYFQVEFSLVVGPHPRSNEARITAPIVPVPGRLVRPHPTVRALDLSDQLAVSRAVRSRALRLLQALAVACDERGYAVSEGSDRETLTITVNGYAFSLTVREDLNRLSHQPSVREQKEKARNSWFKIPEHDYVPSGRLIFELNHSWGERQRRWTDGKRSSIDDRLGQIIVELETRAIEAEEKERKRRLREEERRRQWDEAMASARERFYVDFMAGRLIEQMEAWMTSSRLREFCNAFETQLRQAETSDCEASERWLEWARAYCDRLNPLQPLPTAPDLPEPSLGALRPFLDHGWNPDQYS